MLKKAVELERFESRHQKRGCLMDVPLEDFSDEALFTGHEVRAMIARARAEVRAEDAEVIKDLMDQAIRHKEMHSRNLQRILELSHQVRDLKTPR